jgi:hypothetical protein
MYRSLRADAIPLPLPLPSQRWLALALARVRLLAAAEWMPAAPPANPPQSQQLAAAKGTDVSFL